MSKFRTFSALVPAVIVGIVAGVSPHNSVAESVTTISVFPTRDPCFCGSHGGGFEATYNGTKISVSFAYNPNLANPVKHPLVVLKDNKPFQGWDSLLCSLSDETCPIAGSKLTISGRWESKTSFDAYKIYLK